jgi:hypothetical protein
VFTESDSNKPSHINQVLENQTKIEAHLKAIYKEERNGDFIAERKPYH